MTIEISKADRDQAISSLQRYFQENMEEKIGNVTAGALLSYFLDEIGPLVYNKAVADVQEHMMTRVQEVDFEVHEDVFQYWGKFDNTRKKKS